jgi:hypothetical protein
MVVLGDGEKLGEHGAVPEAGGGLVFLETGVSTRTTGSGSPRRNTSIAASPKASINARPADAQPAAFSCTVKRNASVLKVSICVSTSAAEDVIRTAASRPTARIEMAASAARRCAPPFPIFLV